MISTSTAAEVARGVSRLLIQEGFSPILEFTLPNGRRLDVAALGPGGEMLGVEIKVALADLRGDNKWPEYLDYCDLFYFAIPPDFPPEHVPRAAPGKVCSGFPSGAGGANNNWARPRPGTATKQKETGLIVADRYGGAIVKEAEAQSLHASRRKAVTISFAKVAAERLSAILETIAETSSPNLVIPDAIDES
ncbi:MAG TPA: MmcB family DNA repair protein [Rhizomicrobium sp.]|nr:MmcB family DNA repair protein [Rhizomicrobium sp.]